MCHPELSFNFQNLSKSMIKQSLSFTLSALGCSLYDEGAFRSFTILKTSRLEMELYKHVHQNTMSFSKESII